MHHIAGKHIHGRPENRRIVVRAGKNLRPDGKEGRDLAYDGGVPDEQDALILLAVRLEPAVRSQNIQMDALGRTDERDSAAAGMAGKLSAGAFFTLFPGKIENAAVFPQNLRFDDGFTTASNQLCRIGELFLNDVDSFAGITICVSGGRSRGCGALLPGLA